MPSLSYNHNSLFNMSATDFLCQSYIVPCTSVRGHPRSNPDNQGTPSQLHVKQYVPLDNVEPRPGDVTIIAAHASGLPKELYESLWNELLQISRHKSSSFRIRSIWIADAATHSTNGASNHDITNNEASGDEHAHHLLQLIDQFRCLMPPPLVGIGHSTGAHNILQLAQLQPPLFTTIVAIEPIPTSDLNFLRFNTGPSHLSRSRASLEQAALLNHWSTTNTPTHTPSPTLTPESQLQDPMMMSWTPTSAPVPLPAKKNSRSNSSAAGKIPTTAADESELAALARTCNYYPQALQNSAAGSMGSMDSSSSTLSDWTSTSPQQSSADQQVLTPDALATSSSFAGLPFLAPGCLYIDGNRSAFWTASRDGRAVKLEHTGTGIGGSGGRVEGRVKSAVVEGSHFAPLENPRAVAGLTGMWLEEELGRWRERQREWEQHHVEEMECGMVDQERMPAAAGSKEAREWLQRFRGKKGKREMGRRMTGPGNGTVAANAEGREQDWKITSTPWCPGFEY